MAREGLEIGICGAGPRWAGVEEILRQQEGLRVRRLGNSLAAALREIVMLSPHAVLFESGRADPADIAAVLGRLPGTRLIGLSAAGDAITVYLGQRATGAVGGGAGAGRRGRPRGLVSQPKGERHHAQR